MPEATCVIVDNSEFSRNGDLPVNRLVDQLDAVDAVIRNKLSQSAQAVVSLVASGGPEVVVPPTHERQHLQKGLRTITHKGLPSLVQALQVAMLSLRYRPSKDATQRIVMFVGSPLGPFLEDAEKRLKKEGKRLRKARVSLDIVSFGACSRDNHPLLTTLIQSCNRGPEESCNRGPEEVRT
ncbi:proteasome subunit Rpn10 [Kipferlia bialata]|uniref:Proteasome subunit Rpn10 n=1 Tax=Kipferlia bialata TaxID=797122 RepID=A0A9K3CQG3_9EUKA|nr:proteasome subunit Rpn10 [Kipferlia bialata]|eukprot:g1270.t1